MDRHPAGRWLLNLSLGRDCTALFESYHLRPDIAVARLKQLPQLADFPIAAVPVAPRPNDSDLYVAIRDRVRTEVFKGEVRCLRTSSVPLQEHLFTCLLLG
jgi:acyl-lipid (7-3)-desaturase (Delta-4 desaturase)